jgi:hypothetical protein
VVEVVRKWREKFSLGEVGEEELVTKPERANKH